MTVSLEALRKNRSSALVYGGSAADRRELAQAAAQELEGAVFVEAADDAAVARALQQARAVVYVPDTGALSFATQRAVVRVLREREEKPKFVLGLPVSPDTAVTQGTLTEDLRFWLKATTVDVKARARR